MSYWISLVSNTKEHYPLDDDGVHCSWNYSNLFSGLPCGYERDWQGKMAKDLIPYVVQSLYILEVYGLDADLKKKYGKLIAQFQRDYGEVSTVDGAKYILKASKDMFERHPTGIVVVE
ncbi:hypothetical protein [Lactobacillus hominis]|uniref:Uncharacterized protein n=1 Tax=Lactobacillus hominis DSM 23910 = CRBIP 24.179 TaxID=1423758 RepID=I7IVK4_9LACO|nr:hypothetical protein [Lactobacillus hominis]KRM85854.1 hypothetical protein FC41_GL000042 [Lactobacillus hominis DSM 23910 = CRBIP 24.179]MCT3348908.1 hypothetical protein [Lactobacillus hominis]CCI81598.1 Putative uncharacterized protein [Lactobacillus hominis DSM 23910 = CRBIP 24.179]